MDLQGSAPDGRLAGTHIYTMAATWMTPAGAMDEARGIVGKASEYFFGP